MKNSIAQFFLNALLSILIVAAGLALYERTVLRPALVIRMVDDAEVFRA
jgi:spore coat polysaccharide biosynthesis predicted glycosyltransferase SpsG